MSDVYVNASNGHVAVAQILQNIRDEVEKGTLVPSKVMLLRMIQQAPMKWFCSISCHKNAGLDTRNAYVGTILSLISSSNSLFSLSSDGTGDASNNQSQEYKEHMISALSIISLLLVRLHVSKDDGQTLENGQVGREGKDTTCLVQGTGDKCGIESAQREEEQERRDSSTGDEDCRHCVRAGSGVPCRKEDTRGHFVQEHGHGDLGKRSDDRGYSERVERVEDEKEESQETSDKLLKDVIKSTVGSCIVLCARHTEMHPWSDGACLQAANELLAKLTTLCGCDTLSMLLQGSHHGRPQAQKRDSPKQMRPKGVFGLVMAELRKQLTREEWKKQPTAKHAFFWCLNHMKHPYLGEHLDTCIPPSLLFVDDYQLENKIIGIQCLQHIISNVDPTELRWYGRAEVIYEALHPLLYNARPHLIDTLYPCLMSILTVVENDPKKSDQPRQLGRYDTTLQTILTNMEGEMRIAVRQANARHLHTFIEAMGITILWHMKRLMRVIMSYLEASDGPEETGRILTLRILQVVIVQAWPRMGNHCVDLIKSLLRLLVDISRKMAVISTDAKDTIAKECVECMVLLKRCCGNTVEESLQKLIASRLQDQFLLDCLKRMLADR